jgi:hypothetical protein
MPRRNVIFRKTDSWEFGHETPADEQPLAAPKKRRAATTIAFTALFFAGAAFTAVAGDNLAQINAPDSASASTDSTTTVASAGFDPSAPAAAPTTTDASSAAPAPAAPDPSATPTDASAPASSADPSAASSDLGGNDALKPSQAATGDAAASTPTSSDTGSAPASASRPAKAPKASRPQQIPLHRLLFPQAHPAAHAKTTPAEIEGPSQYATIWLNSPLPDPTPPALRLSARFARNLKAAASKAGIDWSLELGILRARGLTGHAPATARVLDRLAGRLGTLAKSSDTPWATALSYDGSPSFADKALALARYDRAVGINALVHGLEAAKPMLEQRLLNDPQISIYPGGRSDIANGKVDVRVLAVISYLHEAFGEVSVTCLISGHRLFARPGVVSAHVYGRAVDIAALGGTSILGHQEPGGVTEQAVRDILLLPSEVMPNQVISLLGLGGPSFPLADHYNHIHIGF